MGLIGRVAEWSCRGLQILVRRFDSGLGLHSNHAFLAFTFNTGIFLMNIFHFFHKFVLATIEQLKKNHNWPEDLDTSKVVVEPPKESSHGDLSTNAAMVLAKAVGMNPRALADIIAQELKNHPEVESIAVAGPGFINMTIREDFWRSQLQYILTAGVHYGDSNIGENEYINVEYVSANPTGPLHTGHGRNAVFGDAIASLLEKVGYKVCREYYVNDAGGQTDILARSVYQRYRQALGCDVPESAFEGLYPGDYLVPVAESLAKEHGNRWLDAPESEWIDIMRATAIDTMMDLVRDDLAALGVHMNVFTSERKLVQEGRVEEALKILEDHDDMYVGVLEKPKGHDDAEWEERPQTLFKATKYGDDVDRPVKKSDGSWTYFAGDIAYHLDKYRRGFTTMVDVLGADHGGYIKRIQAATKAVTNGRAHAEVKVCQMVNFMENGVAIRMSKRAGTFIKLRDVVDRVGKDVTRFIMLTRRQDVGIDFDFAKVTEQTRDNPVFYIQYAHARTRSILRHGETLVGKEEFNEKLTKLLTDPAELDIIKLLAGWPRQVEIAAMVREPHRIAFYLNDVAAAFHGLWNKGKENTELRFIDPENGELTKARLFLVQAIATVIASGLTLFGITPVEEMR